MDSHLTNVPEGKVEAYLRQNEQNIRHYQEKYADTKQPDALPGLRSVTMLQRTTMQDDEHNLDVAQTSAEASGPSEQPQRFPQIMAVRRDMIGRVWVFTQILEWLRSKEPYDMSKRIIVLISGGHGSGKTTLCREMCHPSHGSAGWSPQRLVNKRLLGSHFVQCDMENQSRAGEFVRKLVLQLLSYSALFQSLDKEELKIISPAIYHEDNKREECIRERRSMYARFAADAAHDDGEDSTEPLLADTDDEEDDVPVVAAVRRHRTIDRIHERSDYTDAIGQEQPTDGRVHEYITPTAATTSRGHYHAREQLMDVDDDARRSEQAYAPLNPKSRIPISNFRYPNKSELRAAAACDHSPQRTLPRMELRRHEPHKAICRTVEEYERGVPAERAALADAYYKMWISDPRIRDALSTDNLEHAPGEALHYGYLRPLLEMPPPKHGMYILIDDIDEDPLSSSCADESDAQSKYPNMITELLVNHIKMFPPWLRIVCTAKKRTRALNKLILGHEYHKLVLSDVHNSNVTGDVYNYVGRRVLQQEILGHNIHNVNGNHGMALHNLCIKNVGCMLYLEKVLDGLADGSISIAEVNDIPSTLNGLYLWLTKRLFNTQRFKKVRVLLEVLLAAGDGVTEEMLFACMAACKSTITRREYDRRRALLNNILKVEGGHLRFFHHSYAHWLLEVKHCTSKYLCSTMNGHATLAMYYAAQGRRLDAIEVQRFAFHMMHYELYLLGEKKQRQLRRKKGNKDKMDKKNKNKVMDFSERTIATLWIMESGCDIDAALFTHYSAQLEQIAAHEHRQRQHSAYANDIGVRLPPGFAACPVLIDDRFTIRNGDVVRFLEDMSRIIAQQQMTVSTRADASNRATAKYEATQIFDVIASGTDETLIELLKQKPEAIHLSCPEGSGKTAILFAAGSTADRANTLRILFAHGACVNAADNGGKTPLIAAAYYGHPAVAEVICQFGAEVNAKDHNGQTALDVAVSYGHLEFTRRVLAYGAIVSNTDNLNRTPLFAAMQLSKPQLVRALVLAGAHVDHTDVCGVTPLFLANGCNGGECASLLLERGADVNWTDDRMSTPMHAAAHGDHVACVEMFLEHDADAEAMDNAGRTPLSVAVSRGKQGVVRALLFWGASVDTMDPEGRTVLSIAAAQGNSQVVRLLLDRGMDEQHRDNSGWVPLHYAAHEGHVDACETLLEAGARLDETDNDGRTALMMAAQRGHIGVVKMLLEKYTLEVDKRAHDGKTAFMLAALRNEQACAAVLFGHGANVNIMDADSRSTLYLLVLENATSGVRFLLNCSANVDTRDPEGRTPLHVAAWQDADEMIGLLINEGGACINARDKCSRTALHAAAWRGNRKALCALLTLGANPSAVCTQGATPLSIAAQEGFEDCVELLMKYGADETHRDHCGRTPAEVATRLGRLHVCEMIAKCAAQRTAITPPLCSSDAEMVIAASHTSATAPLAADDNEVNRYSYLPLGKRKEPLHTGALTQSEHQSGTSSSAVAQRASERDNTRTRHKNDRNSARAMREERDGNRASHQSERDDMRARRRDRGHVDREHPNDIVNSTSPMYVSPPRSPASEAPAPMDCAGAERAHPLMADEHFNRDTHMRIILGRDTREQHDAHRSRRSVGASNPAMRLVANVRNGLDNAAANIRRTGVALAASASSANPAVRTNAFQWRRETPL